MRATPALGAQVRRLDPAIARYLDELGSPVVQMGPARPSVDSDAASVTDAAPASPLRLWLADGRSFKLQLLASAEQTRRATVGLAAVAMRCFPPVLAAGRQSLLTPWVEGTPFDEVAADPADLAACARLQAQLHSRPVPSGVSPRRTVEDWWRWAQRASQDMVEAGVVAASRRAAVLERAGRCRPATANHSWIHRDFCAENMVISSFGEISVVDNESLELGIPEYDLARTWCRWPMPARDWRFYLAEYARRRDTSAFVIQFDFWAAVAVLGSAYFRWRHSLAGAGHSAARFEQLATLSVRLGTGGPTPDVRHYARSGLSVQASCSDAGDLDWLDEFLCPWFDVASAEPGAGAQAAVGLQRDSAAFDSLRRQLADSVPLPVPCFSLDGGPLRLPSCTAMLAGASGLAILDAKFDVAYFLPEGSDESPVQVVAAPDNLRARLALLRVVREFLYQHLLRSPAGVLHAAALGRDGAVAAFVGVKGVGKTTLAAYCVAQPGELGDSPAHFVSNDRVEIRADGRGFAAVGIPTIISVRPGTLALLPALQAALGATPPGAETGSGPSNHEAAAKPRAGRPVHLSPAQFCRATGACVQCGGSLRAIVFLESVVEGDSVQLSRLAPEETVRRLAESQPQSFAHPTLADSEDRGGEGLRTVFASHVAAPRHALSTSSPLSAVEVAAAVPGFSCRVGARAFGDPRWATFLLEQLLPTVAGSADRVNDSG